MEHIKLDELYKKAKKIILNARNTSVSYLQRQLHISWSRANTIIKQLEEMSILGKPNKKYKRKILIPLEDYVITIKQRKFKKK